jgi:hypothetical protein
MTIHAVAAEQAPDRTHKRIGIAASSDFVEALETLKNPDISPLKKSTALVITMTDPMFSPERYINSAGKPRVPGPEVALAECLRRYFLALRAPLVAYQCGKMQVAIRKSTPGDPVRKTRKK